MSNVIGLQMEKKFPVEQEIFDQISEVIDRYNGEVSLVAMIGILELKKHTLIMGN